MSWVGRRLVTAAVIVDAPNSRPRSWQSIFANQRISLTVSHHLSPLVSPLFSFDFAVVRGALSTTAMADAKVDAPESLSAHL